jgi:hypothetical protein
LPTLLEDYEIVDRSVESRRVLPRHAMLEPVLRLPTDHRSRAAIRSEMKALGMTEHTSETLARTVTSPKADAVI